MKTIVNDFSLDLAESNIIPIRDAGGIKTVNARDLWERLESKQDFSTWIKSRLDGFVEEVDFTLHKFVEGRATKIDYHLTIDTAKHLAMLERNERGMQIRQYFIKVENESRFNVPKSLPEALRLAAEIEEQRLALAGKVAIMEPKAAFFDQVAASKTAITMREVAAALNLPGWGRNKVFSFLRESSILDDRNIPYREYQDRGYFRVVERSWTDDKGESHVSLTTLVYQKGIDYIRRLIAKEEVSA